MEWHLISNQWAHFNVVSWEVKVVFGEVIHSEAGKGSEIYPMFWFQIKA